MITITRIFPFDAGHRVLGHEGKCANLHGHGYLAHVTVKASELDKLGRVVDFGCLKEIIGGWIDKNWDHNMILNSKDPLAYLFRNRASASWNGMKTGDVERMFGKEPYLMPLDRLGEGTNPTAENLAKELYFKTTVLLPQGIEITQVRMWETQKCYADAIPEQRVYTTDATMEI